MPDYIIRTMSRSELDFAVELAAGEGWNPGLYDADCFYAADPEGFLIGVLDGEPVSCISVVKYGSDYGFLGFYIVKPGYRGQGCGYRIWQEGMKRLERRTVGLDGVPAQVPNYERSGFRLAYYNTRYRGEATDEGEADDPRIVELARIPFDELRAYDEAAFGYPRPDFLRLWISRPGTAALGLMEGGRLAGYGAIRQCREGYKIAPLFADRVEYADALFASLASRVPPGAPVFIDVPGEAQNPAAALAHRHGMTAVFQAARMYRMREAAAAVQLPLERWFGVTSYELG